MKKIAILLFISCSILLAGFQTEEENKKFEEFKGLMERYHREYSAPKRLSRIINKVCCFVSYTVKVKQMEYGGLSRGDFGGSKIEENTKFTFGTIVSPDGLVMIDGDIFQEIIASAGSRSGFMSYGGATVSKPYNFRIFIPETKKEYNAKLMGVNEDFNVAFLRASLPEGQEIDFLDVENASLDQERLSRVEEHDNFIYMELSPIQYPPSKFEHLAFIFSSRPFTKFKDLGYRRYAVFTFVITRVVPVFDSFNLKLLGFSVSVNEKMVRQTAMEGLADQGGAFNLFFSGYNRTGNVILAKHIADALKDTSSLVSRSSSWTGITEFQPLSKDFTDMLGMTGDGDEPFGIVSIEVVKDSPAYEAGLRSGDIITHWDGRLVQAADKEHILVFMDSVESYLPGNKVEVSYRRYDNNTLGDTMKAMIQIAEAPTTMLNAETYFNEVFGVMFVETTQDRISRSAYLYKRHLGQALIKDAESGGWFEVGGLHPNDVVLKVNDMYINNIGDVKKAMELISEERPKDIYMMVERSAETMFVKITPDWNRID